MRTTNPELLAEIDGLCQMSGVESHQLELVKHIEELEQQLSFEKRQKAKAREQRDEQTQLAKKYKDQLSVLLNKK